MPCHTVVSWTLMIQAHAENGLEEHSLVYATAVLGIDGITPDARTFLSIFSACSRLAAKRDVERLKPLEMSFRAHARLLASEVKPDIILENSLVNVYSKCDSMVDSRRIFDRMKEHDIITWNTLLLGYAENGEELLTLKLFESSYILPTSRSFVAAIKACINLACGEEFENHSERSGLVAYGKNLHSQAVENGCDSDIYVLCCLVNMYTKFREVFEAKRIFDQILNPDVVCYNAMILGYVENGEPTLAIELFRSMLIRPDALIFLSVLKACSLLAEEDQGGVKKLESLERGIEIHSHVRSLRFDLDVYLASALIDMYSKCGSLLDARAVFDRMAEHNVVLWNTLILGCVENGDLKLALELFHCMTCPPDRGSFLAVLKACTHLASNEEGVRDSDGKLVKKVSLETGSLIHSRAKSSGCDLSQDISLASILVGMYYKCGSLLLAQEVSGKMARRDKVSWTTLIMGYVENGEGLLALELYTRMKQECRPDARAFVAALKACSAGAMLHPGKALHEDIIRCGLESDLSVGVTLVDLYGKCGTVSDARHMFESHHAAARETVAWNALLEGYSREGEVGQVLELFHRMVDEEGVHANEATFVSVLSACSHAASVRKGEEYFRSMSVSYGVTPRMEHYACMTDMLSRAGLLDEAVSLIRGMPYEPNSVVWTSILAAARTWNNLRVGKLAFDSLVEMDNRAAR